MNQVQPILIIDDSDSDDCKIDETRSAPKRTLPPNPRQFYVQPTPSQLSTSQARYSKISGRGDQNSVASYTDPRFKSAPKKVLAPPERQISYTSASSLTLNIATPVSQSANRDYSNRRVEVRESRRCTVCVEEEHCCDGGTPCASCFDPGFICLYPCDDPEMLYHRKFTEEVGRTAENETTSTGGVTDSENVHSSQEEDYSSGQEEYSSGSIEHRRIESSKGVKKSRSPSRFVSGIHIQLSKRRLASASSILNSDEAHNIKKRGMRFADESSQHEQHEQTTAKMETDSTNDVAARSSAKEFGRSGYGDNSAVSSRARGFRSVKTESIPTTTWLPNTLEDIEKLIKTHEANINSHREYIVEAHLADAKLKSKQNIHLQEKARGTNPFKKMIAADSDIVPSCFLSDTLVMKIKYRRGDYANIKVPARVLGDDKAAHVPEYKSIGRLRSTFLARNAHGLKYVPYHSGIEEKDLDQRRKDLETRFKDHSSEEFRRQRECLEMVYQWSNDFDQILSEVGISGPQLWKWISYSAVTTCPKCEISWKKPATSTLSHIKMSREENDRCRWLYHAFMKTTQIGAWHLISPRPGHLSKPESDFEVAQDPGTKKEQILCSLCFTHNCLTHGSFLDQEIVVGEAVVNDAEEQNNERQKAVLQVGNRKLPSHVCGLFCFDKINMTPDFYPRIIGIDDKFALVGVRNEKLSMLVDLGPFRSILPCMRSCFLHKKERIRGLDAFADFAAGDISTVRKLMSSMAKMYSSHLRLPCMIGKVAGVDCMNAFYLLLEEVALDHQRAASRAPIMSESLDTRKLSAKAAGYLTGKTSLLENRNTWIPCSHDGPCLPNHSDCACAWEQVHCESSCGCSENCRRRFKGCRCKKTCFSDDRCECYANNRECDPQLCHECGVEEVLDPSNKYREEIRNGRCRNNRLQLDLPPRTVKGMSEVQGWGLFLGEDLPANSFVGEYKGENISASESDRRGAIYAYVSQEYLFNLNKDNQLDGSRFGNKTRFINNSKAKEFINLFPKVMFVNGVTRIGLFTNRLVRAGEELLYDYGYPAELVKGEFWEKHERAIEHNGVVTPIAKPKFRPRMAKNAVDTPGQDDEDEATPVRKGIATISKKKKRKRLVEEDMMELDHGHSTRTGVDGDILILSPVVTDSSDYEETSPEGGTSSHGSGEEEDDDGSDESEDELSIPTRRVVPTRIDRRRGGEAQRRAAQTRLLNRQRARQPDQF